MRALFLILMTMMFCSTSVFSQNEATKSCYLEKQGYLVVDMGVALTAQIAVKPGKNVRLKLMNALPDATYSIEIDTGSFEVMKSIIPTDEIYKLVGGVRSGLEMNNRNDKAIELNKMMVTFSNKVGVFEDKLKENKIKDEIELRKEIITLKRDVDEMENLISTKGINFPELIAETKNAISLFEEVENITTKIYDNQVLRVGNNNKLKITITRLTEDYIVDTIWVDTTLLKKQNSISGSVTDKRTGIYTIVRAPKNKSWIVEVIPDEPGFFKPSYGLGFSTPVMTKSELYYSKSTGNGEYILTAENTDTWTDFVYIPYIFVNYYKDSFKARNGFSSFNPSIGIGLKEEAPAIFLGVNFSIQQSFNIHLGLSAYRGYKLMNKYNEGDILNTNLDKSQLHDKTFLVNPVISISFSTIK